MQLEESECWKVDLLTRLDLQHTMLRQDRYGGVRLADLTVTSGITKVAVRSLRSGDVQLGDGEALVRRSYVAHEFPPMAK